MRIGLITTIWKRPRLTQIFLDYFANMNVEGVDLVLSCTVSPEDPTVADLRIPEAWNVEEFTNTDISQKFNRSMRYMKDQDVRGVIVMGSDDFICPRYVHMVERKLFMQIDYIRPHSLYLHDLQTRRMVYLSVVNAGAGRVFHRNVLERSNWYGWPNGVNKKLDGAQSHFLGRFIDMRTLINLNEYDVRLVDVKGSGVNIWPYRDIARRGRPIPVPSELFWRGYFPEIADEILSFHDTGINGDRARAA